MRVMLPGIYTKINHLIKDVSRDRKSQRREKKWHLFVYKDDASIAVQNGLEGETSQTDVVL